MSDSIGQLLSRYLLQVHAPADFARELNVSRINVGCISEGLAAAMFASFEHLQKTTWNAKKVTFGFSQIIESLRNLDPTTKLIKTDFRCGSLVGYAIQAAVDNTLIGCVLVRVVTNQIRTPPNWDGSIEQLKAFNAINGDDAKK